MSLKPMFFVLRVELCVFAETLVERKKKKYHVTMDRVRCKLLAVWKTCVQTDWQTGCGGAISGVELEDRAARDERRRVTGPAVTLFKTLSPSPFFYSPPTSPSISPPTPPENHGSSRLQDLTKKKMNSVVVLKEYSTE